LTPTARGPRSRPDPTAALFQELVSQGPSPMLHHVSGTIRIDLHNGPEVEHWYVTLDKGGVAVSHRNTKADAVMRAEKKLFDGMCKGTVNADAAVLRGVLDVEGNLGLLTSFARLFPGPPRSRDSFLEREKERSG
jgi:putative sterol carrier protein